MPALHLAWKYASQTTINFRSIPQGWQPQKNTLLDYTALAKPTSELDGNNMKKNVFVKISNQAIWLTTGHAVPSLPIIM